MGSVKWSVFVILLAKPKLAKAGGILSIFHTQDLSLYPDSSSNAYVSSSSERHPFSHFAELI